MAKKLKEICAKILLKISEPHASITNQIYVFETKIHKNT